MRLASYELIEPQTGETPLVVEVPHAGLWLDPCSMAFLQGPISHLGRDADLYVDDLMAQAPQEGATLLVARFHRYVVDLNRAPDDYDERAVDRGATKNRPFGLIWRSNSEGAPLLTGPLSSAEFERRLQLIYRPYHQALEQVIERKRRRFGCALILSAHSMPSMSRPSPGLPALARADVVVGSRGKKSAASSVLSLVQQHTHSYGWTLSHDDPYPGGATTVRWGRPAEGLHAVQLELARRLYMDEQTLEPREDGFSLTQAFCRGLVAKLGRTGLG